MMIVRRCLAMIALCIGIASPVISDAFFDPPYITPPNPIVGQDVMVNIHDGGCDAILSHPSDPSYPHVVRDGYRISVTYFGVRYTNLELCFFQPATDITLLGDFPQGAYEVELRLYYMNEYGDFQTDIIGTTSFIVAGAPPPDARVVAAPALGRPAILLLAIVLSAIGVAALRAVRPAPRRS